MKTEYLLLFDGAWFVYPGMLKNSFELRSEATHWNTCKTSVEAESFRATLPLLMQASTKIMICKTVQKELE